MIHYITTNGIGNAWVANELRIVERKRIPYRLHSMRAPHQDFFVSNWARRIHESTRFIYPLPFSAVVSVLLAPFIFRGRFLRALANALFGKRESLRARVAALAHLAVACHWARQLRGEPVSLIHSQWIHSSGTIGMYGAWLLDVPFSFTGHAADLFRDRVALEDKIRRARFIICISTFHRELYKKLGARDDQLHIAYCGIDVTSFSPASPRERPSTPRILASGRLVGKKGFGDLIEACRTLVDRGERFECTIAGSGPLEPALREQIAALDLDGHVSMTGCELKQEDIPAFMRSGDVYCLPCVRSADGDIDGLPQMLMEAMACGVPVVSTRLVGIPDLVIHERTGILVQPGNPEGLADALSRMLHDEALRARLAREGRRWVEEHFDIDTSLEPLLEQFEKYRALAAGVAGRVSPDAARSLESSQP